MEKLAWINFTRGLGIKELWNNSRVTSAWNVSGDDYIMEVEVISFVDNNKGRMDTLPRRSSRVQIIQKKRWEAVVTRTRGFNMQISNETVVRRI